MVHGGHDISGVEMLLPPWAESCKQVDRPLTDELQVICRSLWHILKSHGLGLESDRQNDQKSRSTSFTCPLQSLIFGCSFACTEQPCPAISAPKPPRWWKNVWCSHCSILWWNKNVNVKHCEMHLGVPEQSDDMRAALDQIDEGMNTNVWHKSHTQSCESAKPTGSSETAIYR
jgi:hypothetical protein